MASSFMNWVSRAKQSSTKLAVWVGSFCKTRERRVAAMLRAGKNGKTKTKKLEQNSSLVSPLNTQLTWIRLGPPEHSQNCKGSRFLLCDFWKLWEFQRALRHLPVLLQAFYMPQPLFEVFPNRFSRGRLFTKKKSKKKAKKKILWDKGEERGKWRKGKEIQLLTRIIQNWVQWNHAVFQIVFVQKFFTVFHQTFELLLLNCLHRLWIVSDGFDCRHFLFLFFFLSISLSKEIERRGKWMERRGMKRNEEKENKGINWPKSSCLSFFLLSNNFQKLKSKHDRRD